MKINPLPVINAIFVFMVCFLIWGLQAGLIGLTIVLGLILVTTYLNIR